MNRLMAIFGFVLLAASLPAAAQVDPCKLLTPAEIESVLGIKVPKFTHGSVQGSNTVTCNGDAVKGMSVGMMYAPPKPGDPKIADHMSWIETYSRDSAKAIGAKLNVQRFGSSIICTQLITPKGGLGGFSTPSVMPSNRRTWRQSLLWSPHSKRWCPWTSFARWRKRCWGVFDVLKNR